MLSNPSVASAIFSAPTVWWARTSTMATATRLATAANSVSTSAVVLLVSSLVARAAVVSADIGQMPNQTVLVNESASTSQPMLGAYTQLPNTAANTPATSPIAADRPRRVTRGRQSQRASQRGMSDGSCTLAMWPLSPQAAD